MDENASMWLKATGIGFAIPCAVASILKFSPHCIAFGSIGAAAASFSIWLNRKPCCIVPSQAALLGCIFCTGVSITAQFAESSLSCFGRYMIIFSMFHFTEFVVTAISNPATLKVDSFLLNHSKDYWIAAVSSWIEFVAELYLAPSLKLNWVSWLGFGLCIVGEIIRKTAMLQAGLAFTHQIASNKKDGHELVTNGVYAFCRHPGYAGWYLWSVSTQVILCNPICLLGFAIVSYLFFDSRIYDEECKLLAFFGSSYVDYKRRVPSGVPFVSGVELD